jgi:cell wall-associated NlpC family hydrolase
MNPTVTSSARGALRRLALVVLSLVVVAMPASTGAAQASSAGAVAARTYNLTLLVHAMSQLGSEHLPYCWGGGHQTTPAIPSSGDYCWGGNPLHKMGHAHAAGFDCSSAVSWVLQTAGYQLPTMVSGQFAHWGKRGPGKNVTIWANNDHVFLEVKLDGTDFFWGTSPSNYRNGPNWTPPHTTVGFHARHPAGL